MEIMKEPSSIEEKNQNEVKMQNKVYEQAKELEKQTQRLEVQIFSKQNPQKERKSLQSPTYQYGPFDQNQNQNQHQFHRQDVNEDVNYDIEISPVLTNLSLKNVSSKKKQKNISKQRGIKFPNKKTYQSNNEFQFSKVDQKELQRQIIALAKNIRQKVRRKEQKNDNVHEKVYAQMSPNRKSDDTKMKKLDSKRQNQFQKFIAGKFSIQRISKQQHKQKSTQHQQTTPEKHQNQAKINFLSQSRTNQSKKQRSPAQLPRLKLNLDKTHHRYEMNEFRKIILKEKKDKEIAKSLLIKEKQHALQKRRQIYNQSRYHPVGIKLNALRTSRFPNAQQHFQQKFAETDRLKPLEDDKDLSHLSLMTPQKQNPPEQQKNQGSKDIDPQKVDPNNLEAKSSLTFNFSFSDSTNPISVMKTQNIHANLQPKKWTSKDKQITDYTHIIEQQPSQLSFHHKQQSNYSNIELQYSEI